MESCMLEGELLEASWQCSSSNWSACPNDEMVKWAHRLKVYESLSG